MGVPWRQQRTTTSRQRHVTRGPRTHSEEVDRTSINPPTHAAVHVMDDTGLEAIPPEAFSGDAPILGRRTFIHEQKKQQDHVVTRIASHTESQHKCTCGLSTSGKTCKSHEHATSSWSRGVGGYYACLPACFSLRKEKKKKKKAASVGCLGGKLFVSGTTESGISA